MHRGIVTITVDTHRQSTLYHNWFPTIDYEVQIIKVHTDVTQHHDKAHCSIVPHNPVILYQLMHYFCGEFLRVNISPMQFHESRPIHLHK